MIPLDRVPMLSVHPDAATRDDVANMAADYMEARRLLCLLIPACEKGAHWMNVISKAQLSSATRGILTCDTSEVRTAIRNAKQFIQPATQNDRGEG
jgi:hypothetical protein